MTQGRMNRGLVPSTGTLANAPPAQVVSMSWPDRRARRRN